MKDRYVPGETEPPDGLRLGHDGKLEPIPDPDIAPRRRHGQGRSRSAFYEARDRRNRFVALTEEGKSLDEACAAVGVVRNTYARWRERFPDFAARVDVARAGHKDVTHIDYRGNFTSFRKRYLKMDTTWFQHQFVTALEECPPGEIIMVLWPPEHGKTTTIEDFVNYRLGIDPNSRITVVSERQAHAKRIVRRVRRRMEMDGPTRDYVRKFGPFEVPRDDKHRSKQPWTDEHLDVWKRSVEHFDERDYNLQAVGLGTTIQGVRADWMIFDDIQGLKSINMTESNFELIRQDFFSRPGILGRIVFCGTRVGDNDIYQRLMEEGLIDRLILFPAHDSHGEWLWPERYSEQQYLRLRKRVGEPAWFRNYMQRPTMGKEATFDRDVMLECCNDRRSVDADCPSDPDRPGATVPVTIQVDPALGGANATTVVGLHQRQLVYLHGRVDHDLTSTAQIFDVVEEYIHRYDVPHVSKVTEVVIEAMAFQRGLITDQRADEIRRRFGISIVPHMTGANKYDPDLGVAAMALDFRRRRFDLPFADDRSKDMVLELVAEAVAWRPLKRGTRLRQDRLMALWFGWMRWRHQLTIGSGGGGGWHTEASVLRETG
jgi:hypothetical protein